MASDKQIEANRRNARKSTGPTSAAGKQRVRFNAMTHGLTAKTVVLPGEDADALQRRVEAFKDDVQPRGGAGGLPGGAGGARLRQLDRAERTIAARLTDAMLHGQADAANRQADEVAVLAQRLFWDPVGPICDYPHRRGFGLVPQKGVSLSKTVDDPLNPARIVNRLEATAAGCRWLLDRWGDLRWILEERLKWRPPDRLRAIRLLGKQPLDAPADERVMMIYLACWAMDPDGPHPFQDALNELADAEQKRFIERLDDRGATVVKPADPEAGEAALLAIVAAAVTRLEGLLAGHERRHAVDTPGRLDALAFDDSDPGERLRRYQLACGRTLMRTVSEIFKIRRSGHEPGARAIVAPDSPLADLPEPTPSGTVAAPILFPDPIGLLDPIEPMQMPAPVAVAVVDSPLEPFDETNPIPAPPPPAPLLDPCSEGLWFEAGTAADLADPLAPVPTRREPTKDGRRATSRPIPPMIIEALKMLVVQQRPAAEAANPDDPDDDSGGVCAQVGGRSASRWPGPAPRDAGCQ